MRKRIELWMPLTIIKVAVQNHEQLPSKLMQIRHSAKGLEHSRIYILVISIKGVDVLNTKWTQVLTPENIF